MPQNLSGVGKQVYNAHLATGAHIRRLIKVCLNRYSWGAGKVGSEYSSWFIRLESISCPVQICMQIGLKMEAGDCPKLNMNAMENYLLSHSLNVLDQTLRVTYLGGLLSDRKKTLKLKGIFNFNDCM